MLRFAKNLAGNRIFIDNTNGNDIYYCEECNARLIPKKGDIKQHHFAHIGMESLTSFQKECAKRNSVEYEMSEWHRQCQNSFPLEWQEYVIKNKKGQTCRADVYLEKNKTVIEFQHSKICAVDFQRRNTFYTDLGLSVIWLFNFDSMAEGKVKWVHPDNYDAFITEQIIKSRNQFNEEQDAYKIDKQTYLNTFGAWKVQDNRKVKIYFVQTVKAYTFYKQIKLVTGNFKYDYPLTLFTANSDFF